MQTVLSIDVDYFVTPKVFCPDPGERPDDARHRVREFSAVECFLMKPCLLNPGSPIRGRAACDHDAAFPALREWIEEGFLSIPFRLVHIDAHADLGLGDAGYAEVLNDVLRRPLHERSRNFREFSLGNWLAYAIANRWIGEVIFLREPGPGRDPELLACYFCGSPDFSELQMRPMTEYEYMPANDYTRRAEFVHLPTEEPKVRWVQIGEEAFRMQAPPHAVFTCQSPLYSPPTADRIFELVRTMLREDHC